jgi:glyoxylase-like metal-dependent hydrolase (beta-lactamase superfamily II)
LSAADGLSIDKILITHGHMDHVGALAEIKAAAGVQVYLHPADANRFDLPYDISLEDMDLIQVGELKIRPIHTPGHTPGLTCFDLGDQRIIVGDTIFIGGPGKTWSANEFAITMKTMQEIVFAWPNETEFFPGHGPAGKIGQERPAYEAFVARGWSADLYGDVTWEG